MESGLEKAWLYEQHRVLPRDSPPNWRPMLFSSAERLVRTICFLEGPLTAFSVSESGALAFRAAVDMNSVIAIFNRKGERIGAAGPPGDYAQITLSPDEKRPAVDRREDGSYDIWMLKLASGVFSRVTFDPANDRDPVFSPDGREIVFTNNRLGTPQSLSQDHRWRAGGADL
jgi:hypothetical protein